MKILFWTGKFPPYIGGLEQFGLQLLTEMRQRGHDVLVVSMQGNMDLLEFMAFEQIPVYRFDFAGTIAAKDPRRIAAMLRRIGELKQSFRPDLVHLNDFTTGVFFHERTMDAYSCPTIYTIHTSPLPGFERNSLLGRMLLASAWIPAVSQAMLDHVLQCVPEMADRASVVYNGLKAPMLPPTPLSFAPPRLLCIGRVIADKGFDLAVDAAASLLPRYPSLRLIIAGDGEYRPFLEAQAARLGIAHAVEFPGWIAPEAIHETINRASMVLVPSRWDEPFGLVAAEAAQMARPVVAAEVGGLPEVVLHGQTGLVVERHNPLRLAEGIEYLLDHPDEARTMGENARQRALDRFSLRRMADDYERLYRAVVAGAAT